MQRLPWRCCPFRHFRSSFPSFPMSSLANRMNDILLRSAEAGGAESMEAVEKIIAEAAQGQRPVIEELLDSRLMSEEDFLAALSQRLNLPWEPVLKPRNARRLKE